MSSLSSNRHHDGYPDMSSSPDAFSQPQYMGDETGTIDHNQDFNDQSDNNNNQGDSYGQHAMIEGDDQNYIDDNPAHQGMTMIPAAAINIAAIERRAFRPAYKLSVRLIDTYKTINKIYYEKKAKRLKEQQAMEQQPAPSSSSGSGAVNGRTGANNDGYDDSNYNLILPEANVVEVFDNRYVFKYKIGSGSFGQVVCAYDQFEKVEVAIKIIKSKRPFLVQAQTEIQLLQLVKEKQLDEEGNEADYNCITLEDTFMYHNHQCLVFEMLSYNLYDLLRNSKFRGVSFGLVRKFGRQILIALEFLSRSDVDIVHCDLKPENILLRHPKRSAIKIIDFGSSCNRSSRPYTYIQSRFYRSPEVLLCLGYNQKIDIWSLGCVLVEMHTGEPLFGGKDQLDQLFRIITVLGMPPLHMIENCAQTTRNIFFEQVPVPSRPHLQPDFPSECDPTKKILSSDQSVYYVVKKPKSFNALPLTRTLDQVLGVFTGGPGGRRLGEAYHEVEHYQEFADLIRKLLIYDPQERWSATTALEHSFFSSLRENQPITTSSGVGSPRHRQSAESSASDANRSNDPLAPRTIVTESETTRTTAMMASPVNDAILRIHPEGIAGAMLEESNIFGKRQIITPAHDSPRIRSRSAPSGSYKMRLRSSEENS